MCLHRFSGRWEKSLARDSSDHVYLDFDPKCFRILVNWLVDRNQAVSGGDPSHGSGQQDVPPLPQDTSLHAPFIAMLDYLVGCLLISASKRHLHVGL